MNSERNTERGGLPLPDYDHLSLPALGDRVRALPEDDVRRLIAYEEEHAARVPALEVLRARLAQLESGAEPSQGTGAEPRPEQAPPPAGGSPVTPATQGEPSNPPPHGVPQHPGDGKPKGDYQPGHG